MTENHNVQPVQAAYPEQPPQAVSHAAAPRRARASRLRVGAGIISIVFSLWLAICARGGFVSADTFGNSFGAVLGGLYIPAAVGMIIAGVLLMVLAKGRGRAVPLTTIALAGFALVLGLLGLGDEHMGSFVFTISLILALPVLLLLGKGLLSAKPGA